MKSAERLGGQLKCLACRLTNIPLLKCTHDFQIVGWMALWCARLAGLLKPLLKFTYIQFSNSRLDGPLACLVYRQAIPLLNLLYFLPHEINSNILKQMHA